MYGGALGAVLQLSRALGAAPLARDRGAGWRVSRPLAIYSGVLTTIIGVFVCVHTSLNMLGRTEPWLPLDVMRLAGRYWAALVLALGARSSPARLRRIAATLALLQQMQAKFPRCERSDGQRKALLFLLSSSAACGVAHAADSLLDARVLQHVLTAIQQGAFVFAHCAESLALLQIVLTARRLARALSAANRSLRQLAPAFDDSSWSQHQSSTSRRLPRAAWQHAPQDNRKRNQIRPNVLKHRSSLANSQSKHECTAHAVRQHAACYAALCDAVRAADAADGLYVAAALVLFSLRLGVVLYEIILWGLLINHTTGLPISFPSGALLLCALLVANLIAIMEPFHRTHVEMQRTHFLVASLKFQCRDERVASELELFLRLVRLNKASYSPLGMFTLERSITVTIFATITTYLVIALTYGPEVKNPALLAVYNTNIGHF